MSEKPKGRHRSKVVGTRKRKRDDARNFVFLNGTRGLLFAPPKSFDKNSFVEALKVFSSCTDIACNPLFRSSKLYFSLCNDCRPYWIDLMQMFVLSEDIDGLRKHTKRAFEYVANLAYSLNAETKDKRAFSYSRLQQLCEKTIILLQRSFQLSDLDILRLKKSSLMTCVIIDGTSNLGLAFKGEKCDVQLCQSRRYAKFVLKEQMYNPQTLNVVGSSDEVCLYNLCKCHAHCFSNIHKLMHSFYNAHRNFSYWVEQSNAEMQTNTEMQDNADLNESFLSKLNVKTEVEVGENQASTSFVNSLGIDQMVLQNITDSFVNVFVDLQCKLPAFAVACNSDRIWIAQVLKMKSERFLNLGCKYAPELMEKWDKTRSKVDATSKGKFSRLIYKDE